MAGQRAVQVSQAAAVESGYFACNPVPNQYMPLFVADRKIAIESVIVRYRTGAAGITGTLAHQVSGTAFSSSPTVITGNMDFATADTNQEGALVTSNGVPSTNIVPAGSCVGIVLSGAAGLLAGVSVSIRYTTVII